MKDGISASSVPIFKPHAQDVSEAQKAGGGDSSVVAQTQINSHVFVRMFVFSALVVRGDLRGIDKGERFKFCYWAADGMGRWKFVVELQTTGSCGSKSTQL